MKRLITLLILLVVVLASCDIMPKPGPDDNPDDYKRCMTCETPGVQ